MEGGAYSVGPRRKSYPQSSDNPYLSFRLVHALTYFYCIFRHPVPGGYKHGDLALQVGGVSRIGTIKYGLESLGTQTSSNSKLQIRPLVRAPRAPQITHPKLSKGHFKEKEKLVAGPRWVPNTKKN
jgi:hypothetical protein